MGMGADVPCGASCPVSRGVLAMPPAYMYAQHKVQSLTASNAVLATRDESPGSHPAADEQADSTVNTHLVAQATGNSLAA